jgi:KUP system potassium uptake protein
MAITTVLFYVIARQRWHWPALRARSLAGAFLAIDLAFFGANVVKIAHAAGCRSRSAAASSCS